MPNLPEPPPVPPPPAAAGPAAHPPHVAQAAQAAHAASPAHPPVRLADGDIAATPDTPPRLRDLRRQIHAYLAFHPLERQRLAPLLDHLRQPDCERIFDRATLPGHVTASGVVAHEGRLLMVLHPHLHRWLQPGGHVEAGEDALQAARREVLEETGWPVQDHPWLAARGVPIDIDIHAIPAHPARGEPLHLHYDLRYLFCLQGAPDPAVAAAHPHAWIAPREIGEPGLQALLRKLPHLPSGFEARWP